jgi:hypothetical protein
MAKAEPVQRHAPEPYLEKRIEAQQIVVGIIVALLFLMVFVVELYPVEIYWIVRGWGLI